ncbi:MAG: histidine--tRNA ligase [Clostridia bacterium]|nr:histidine--tRNA ligase [Clostridia bacterium]
MIQKPKGTKDLLPEDSYKWQFVERKVAKVLENYGFKEIRVPVFEYTELFQRGVGETTDVVQKEMYTFDDKGGRSITLRPEGTAGAVRAYLENGMASKPSPVKLYYNMAMYRYENVQKGRLREFHQIGAELIGSSSYLADVDTILMAKSIFNTLNIPNIKLNINSIGCPKCRSEYQKKLREFIGKNLDSYCDTCKTRFEKNPMRILDCKEKKCKELNVGAPMMIDYLCEECKEHFENVKSALSSANVEFEIDSSIVRGLDYYTKTVFEFIDDKTGLTVLGGGRYDGLVEEFGGASTPAVGFATGVERVMELFEATNEQVQENVPDLYIVSCGDKENIKSIEIAENLRKAGVYVEKDIMERSFKAQFKYADKLNCKNVIVIGEDELTSGKVKVKNMATGEEVEAELAPEAIINIIK